jgi:fluoroquinolone transport system permease protein
MMVGVTVGFLLLGERDDRTLTAIQVTPMSMNAYLVYRLAIPLVVSTRAVVVGIPIMGLMAIPSAALAPIALLAALEAPIFALVLASYAANKVEGFAVMKAMGVFLIGPTLACFVAEPWQWLFGVLPTYWPVKACWMALEGRPIWPVLAAGLVVYTAVLVALLRRFNRVVYRLDR